MYLRGKESDEAVTMSNMLFVSSRPTFCSYSTTAATFAQGADNLQTTP